jgi:SPASM domain peptide maturase of grasp-with-spasm system
MYFKLFADCIPVRGVVRSVIYDLGRRDFKLIPNELYDILTEYHTKTLEDINICYNNEQDEIIDEYFTFLVANEFGFYCTKEELDLFPPLPKEFDIPSAISNAIIDTNKGSNHNYGNIFSQLKELQCRFIQLRFYEFITYTDLEKILQKSSDRNIKGLDLILAFGPEFTQRKIEKLIELFPISKIEFHSVDKKNYGLVPLKRDFEAVVLFTKNRVTDHTHCGMTDPAYFRVNKEMFLESLKFNSCLNKKISIDVNGNIKNCPSMPQSYGNIKTTTLWTVLHKQGFKKVWAIGKDKVNICRHCEFRYMCTDCRAYVKDTEYSKPEKCNYDPFTGVWS